MRIGLYRYQEILDGSMLKTLESAYGVPVHIMSVYRAWNRCSIKEDLTWLEGLKNSPRDLLLTWEPWCIPGSNDSPSDQSQFSLKQIVSGRYDRYIRDFSRILAELKPHIYLRPMHEMNGNWYPWCGTVNNNSPEDFIASWHYLRSIVNEEVSGIEWVWSPYSQSYPDTPSNRIEIYFPGDKAVDWIGMDGYNWGTCEGKSGWEGFENIFSSAYKTVTRLSNRPVMITETACAEEGGDKAEWIEDASRILKKRFNRIKVLVWFDMKKECDWRIDSSEASLKAFHLLGAS